MFDSSSWKSRPDHAVCSVETGLHMIKAIKDVRHNTHASFICYDPMNYFCVIQIYSLQ